MSLTKKDPSLRVAANDPHLVSLGGGRLSTAVTIHYIPIGDTTIGSSTACSISLNGSGVRPVHCTIYRSEQNEVTIVPEQDARILIDATKITQETNLTQGAMITIGNSNYLRFNNPAEAQLIRSAMGSNERISMPQIDFDQTPQRDSGSRSTNGSLSDTLDECSEEIIMGGHHRRMDMVRQSMDIETFFETKINPFTNGELLSEESIKVKTTSKYYDPIPPIDINGFQCPKVFTADLVTVNMPAKDVLGQKYANFAKNLAENHRTDKIVNNVLRNNQVSNIKANTITTSATSHQANGSNNSYNSSNYVNIPSTSNFIQNSSSPSHLANSSGSEYLTKVNNTTPVRSGSNHHNVSAYDRYPKPGTYGGLQIFPMNGVNTDINNGSTNSTPQHQKSYDNSVNGSAYGRSQLLEQKRNLSNLSNSESERLEDMLKICSEYADHQSHACSSITSSPIVQNRIKTNGSLPREKKSPFYQDLSGSGSAQQQSFSGSNSNLTTSKSHNNSSSSGYENVRLVGQNRVEINGQLMNSSPKSGYENVVVGKYVPQSPRTKIRTTCMSPKKEQQHSFNNSFAGLSTHQQQQPQYQPQIKSQPPPPNPKPATLFEYDQMIKTFEEKLKIEMQAIEESTRYRPPIAAKPESLTNSPARRINKNINNLTLNLQCNSLQNSPRLSKKPAPAPRTLSKAGSSGSLTNLQQVAVSTKVVAREASIRILENGDADVDQLKKTRKEILQRVQKLRNQICDLQKQETDVLDELNLEKALVSAELNSVANAVQQYEIELKELRHKIHRLEAQRNATRVMEENQQAKLKQSIEMKQDQIKKLREMLKQKVNNDCLKEELSNVSDSLENDRKIFEDLEFQYLEEESEWHAYREELGAEEKGLVLKIEEKRLELQHLERQDLTGQGTTDAKKLKNNLISLLKELQTNQEQLTTLEHRISDVTGQLQLSSSSDDEENPTDPSPPLQSNLSGGMMSQSLFGSAELLCPKRATEDIMSKSVNENMFYNNKIELPAHAPATSTPKRPPLRVVDFREPELATNPASPLHRVKHSDDERVMFNLSLGSDDFEVNPLERRVPSQDDIDRISKVASASPISTSATTKIFDSIKEIERNRQLLLAQQGHHVIEHERQKMHDLKKKSHDEARAQYLLMLSASVDGSKNSQQQQQQKRNSKQLDVELEKLKSEATTSERNDKENQQQQQQQRQIGISEGDEVNTIQENTSQQQRHSQPEFVHESAHQNLCNIDRQKQQSRNSPRPLSEANSELSCDLLSDNTCKSSIELSTATSGIGSAGNRYSAEQNTSGDDVATKRSSVNSNETASAGSGSAGGYNGERKRALPKHQRPLTRYLPIFSPDLDLRQHIESAGHQIALCPHVFVDAFSCRGYLHKLGATFHGWARRWFVLDRQRNAFIYYADKSERKPRGGAYFSTIDEVYLDHLNASKSGRPHCTFIVKTKKRSYHLQAASDAAARIWIDAIITGAQGNLDY